MGDGLCGSELAPFVLVPGFSFISTGGRLRFPAAHPAFFAEACTREMVSISFGSLNHSKWHQEAR